jgi:hypothetical protein
MSKEPRVEIREVLSSDIKYLSENLRDADICEIKAGFNLSPKDGLDMCLEDSDEVWVATIDSIPACIFGLSSEKITNKGADPQDVYAGMIWAMGTDSLFKYPKTLTRTSKKVIGRWLLEHDVLYNYIWSKNNLHKKWLKSLGFSFLEDCRVVNEFNEVFEFFCKLAPIKIDPAAAGGGMD